MKSWLARDPLVLAERALDPEWVVATRAQLEQEIEDALVEAKAAPLPRPDPAASATKESA